MKMPLEYNVIIAVAQVEEKTKGGIILSAETVDSQSSQAQVGRLIAMAKNAFDYVPSGDDSMPKVGDLVWFARFGGKEFTGKDGKTYRIMKDKELISILEE